MVLAVGRALRVIAEHGTFRILWSQIEPAASQHERELRLQVYERDEEDEAETRQQEEEETRQQEEDDELYMQQLEDEEEEDY